MGDKNAYQTTDIALAAYLISQGHDMLDIDTRKPWAVQLIFNDHSDGLMADIHLWEMGKAEANVCDFFRIYKDLIKRVKLYAKGR